MHFTGQIFALDSDVVKTPKMLSLHGGDSVVVVIFIVAPIVCWSLFLVYSTYSVLSSFAIISLRKRELVGLL